MATTRDEIELIIQEGEGYRIEFKERLSNLEREMVAFANGSGGRIFIGITDDGRIVGFHATNEVRSQIQDIANNCDPQVKIIIQQVDDVLVVEVREGTDKPYKCATGFYNRVGPNSQKLSRDEIVEFVKSEGKIRFDEMINRKFTSDDFSLDKLNSFLQQAGISQVLPMPQIIKNLGAGDIEASQIAYNNTAVLFFAKNLSSHYFHTAVTCALYKGNEKVTILDRKDFNEDLISNINETMIFLKKHLNVRYEFDGSPQRQEIPELPYEALREAVINAIVHRDYFQKGANVMIELFDNRLEITSPGGLPKGLREEDFGSVSLLRNPNIANLLHRAGLIEKMGTGIQRIHNLLQSVGLPNAKYKFSDFVIVTFRREINKTSEKTSEKMSGKTSEKTPERILKIINENPSVTIVEMEHSIGLTQRTIERALSKLKKTGKIRRIGPDKGGRWEVINSNK